MRPTLIGVDVLHRENLQGVLKVKSVTREKAKVDRMACP